MPGHILRSRGVNTGTGTGTRPFVVFDVLQLLALLLLAIAYISALVSKSVYRMKTWFALIISCIIYCLSFLLLLGRQSGPPPPFALCVFQAGAIYAAPAVVAASGFVFVLELYYRLYVSISQCKMDERRNTAMMFVAPTIHFLVFWTGVFTGLSNQQAVERHSSGFYCHINAPVPTTVTGVTVVAMIVLMILGEVYTVYYLWKRRSVFREVRRGPNGLIPFRMFVRVALYTLIGGFGIMMVDILMNSNTSISHGVVTLDLLAVVPLSVAIVFGSQMDILSVYMFWKRRRLAKRNIITPVVEENRSVDVTVTETVVIERV